MSIIDRILSLIAPHQCLNCQKQGSLLCKDCTLSLPSPMPQCYGCHRSTQIAGLTCDDCYARSYLRRVYIGTSYHGVAKELIWKLKFGGAQAAVEPMIQRLALMLAGAEFVVVPVPTASSRVRRRGYDQAILLAKSLARTRRLPYCACLRRLGQSHQVGASRDQRLRQLRQAFRLRHSSVVRGKHVLLIDDVMTTGATFESAARVMMRAGAASVSALAFAKAE